MTHIKRTFIIMGIFTLLGSLLKCKSQSANYQSVNADAFEKCIADTAIVRLDVRTAKEYADGHIAKTQNIDVLRSDFKTKALSLLPKNKTIALYCRSGHRSKIAANILSTNGYNVSELSNGFNGWVEVGKEVTK